MAGLGAFLGLLLWPGRRWRVQQLLDDWIFAHDYLHGRRPDVEARLDHFAQALVARSRDGDLDEIVIVGHSLGAMLAIDILVRALARDPDFGRRGAAVCLLTVGATIPKFALHPRAHDIRGRIARVVAEPSIAWTEYQSRDDTISFYKFDPVALKRIAGDRLEGKPVIRRVQIHDMVTAETFARCRRSILRLHYRSVMANDRRARLRLLSPGLRTGRLQRLDDRARGPLGLRDRGRHLSGTAALSHEGRRAGLMTPLVAKLIWLIGVVGWFVIRYPHQRRARRTPKLRRSDRGRELVLMTISATGLGIIPMIYVFTGAPRFADYPMQPWQGWLGAMVFAASLWLFHRTHKDLGRNWSVTLEVREQHALVTNGVYGRVRHPMYSAFWLWALAQALLLPNWIAGPAGLVGFGTLFFLRVGREEALMAETFGDEYRRYMARTSRIVPGIY